jgi:hypothetical protein
MDVEVELIESKVVFSFLPRIDDGVYNEKIKINNTTMFVEFEDIDHSELCNIHPDHLALAIILVSNPFVGSILNIPFAVSEGFKNATKIITKYKINFPMENAAPYSPSGATRPGLSFSGGADSTAALLIMPESTLSVFMDRPLKEKASLYNKSAAYATIEHAKSQGHDVRIIRCDLEYLRTPIGFPSDLAPAIPLILMASLNNIDSIAYGTVLESAYRVGHESCRDYKISGHYRVWGGLFSAANIPLYLPVSGISEVGTSSIVQSSSFKEFTRSCIRGIWPDSCENCWKCFRKNLVESRLIGQVIGDSEMSKWLAVREVRSKLRAWPISHENVLAWSLQGRNVTGNLQQMLLNRTEGSARNMNFLERWYIHCIELIPQQYQEFTQKSISKYLEPMMEDELEQISTHTMTDWLNSAAAKQSRHLFLDWLDQTTNNHV